MKEIAYEKRSIISREIMPFAFVFMSGKYCKYSFHFSLEAELGNR